MPGKSIVCIIAFAAMSLLLSVKTCSATVDMDFVNDYTREYHTFCLEDDYIGLGWRGLGEGDERAAKELRKYRESGYTRAVFPCKIEAALILIAGVCACAVVLAIKGKKHG